MSLKQLAPAAWSQLRNRKRGGGMQRYNAKLGMWHRHKKRAQWGEDGKQRPPPSGLWAKEPVVVVGGAGWLAGSHLPLSKRTGWAPISGLPTPEASMGRLGRPGIWVTRTRSSLAWSASGVAGPPLHAASVAALGRSLALHACLRSLVVDDVLHLTSSCSFSPSASLP